MIKRLPVQEDNILAYRVTGRLRHADYQALLPQPEQHIQDKGKLSVLFELRDFRGWDLAAAWDDFRFTLDHADDFGRIAVVGARRLERWMTALSSPFVGGEIRFFDESQLAEAWDWLREPQRAPEAPPPAPTPYRCILVAIDQRREAGYLIDRARQLAEASGARVHLVQAVDYPIWLFDVSCGFQYGSSTSHVDSSIFPAGLAIR
jgi:universal stress protein A